jgi:hypothetical protein
VEPSNPCHPSPCGPNSQCREINGQAVCSCLPGYQGSPPGCRPECVVNPECPHNRACMSQKCKDPCTGTCGQNALCNVINHSPICSCQQGYTGDPFSRCYPIPRKLKFLKKKSLVKNLKIYFLQHLFLGQHNLPLSILASPIHAALTQHAEILVARHHALACLPTLEIHPTAGQSAQLTLIAPVTRRACAKGASTLALDHVELELSARSSTTLQCAHALLDILAIRSSIAIRNHLRNSR